MKTEKVAVTTNNKTNGGSNMKGFFGGMKKKLVPALCGMGMMMTPTAPITAITSVFRFSSGCVTAEVPVPAAKQVVVI